MRGKWVEDIQKNAIATVLYKIEILISQWCGENMTGVLFMEAKKALKNFIFFAAIYQKKWGKIKH